MKMYAARKGWALAHVRVQLSASSLNGVYVVSRQLEIDGNLDEAQRVVREYLDEHLSERASSAA